MIKVYTLLIGLANEGGEVHSLHRNLYDALCQMYEHWDSPQLLRLTHNVGEDTWIFEYGYTYYRIQGWEV